MEEEAFDQSMHSHPGLDRISTIPNQVDHDVPRRVS